MKKIGYGKDYKYSHDGPGHFVEQEFLPKEIVGKVFYNPAENQRENEMRAYLKKCWNKKYNY
jgi:putative ATPase